MKRVSNGTNRLCRQGGDQFPHPKAKNGMHPIGHHIRQRQQNEGAQMGPRMRQNRVGRGAYPIAHRDNVEVEGAGGVWLAPTPSGRVFDPLQNGQKVSGIKRAA